jgi:hypothetical protein
VRHLVFLALITACTGSPTPVTAPHITFTPTPSTWKLEPAEGGKTRMTLELGEASMDLGTVEGRCVPTPELPFTEVNGQKSFAALVCGSPDGGTHNVVVVEVQSPDDPDWPQPVALAVVLTRTTAEDKVALISLGAVEVPLGIVPVAPVVAAPPPIEPVPETPPTPPL